MAVVSSVLVLADDLTGAADTGVAFASAGLASALLLHGTKATEPADLAEAVGAEAVCVDTDTRHGTPDTAAEGVRSAIRDTGPAAHVYKKVDSTLRGNVAAEIAAAVDMTGSELVFLAPAFPATGRTTVEGRQLVGGEPLAGTATWRAAAEPAPDRVADLFAGSGLDVVEVGLDEVRAGGRPLGDRLRGAAGGGTVVVCDAETDTDLAAVAAAGVSCADMGVLWAGSGGLAPPLIEALGLSSGGEGRRWQPFGAGSLLAVAGSATDQTQAQVRALASAGFSEVRLPAATLLQGRDADLEDLSAELSSAVRHGNTVVTIADGGLIGAGGAAGDARRAARSLGRVVADTSHPGAGLLLTGGETARAVLIEAGVRTLRLIGELEPGIVLSEAGLLGALPVVTKAGAFGDDAALVRAARALAGGT